MPPSPQIFLNAYSCQLRIFWGLQSLIFFFKLQNPEYSYNLRIFSKFHESKSRLRIFFVLLFKKRCSVAVLFLKGKLCSYKICYLVTLYFPVPEKVTCFWGLKYTKFKPYISRINKQICHKLHNNLIQTINWISEKFGTSLSLGFRGIRFQSFKLQKDLFCVIIKYFECVHNHSFKY